MDSQTSLNFTASGREHQGAEPENESLAGAAATPRVPGDRRLGPFKINFEFKLLNVFSRRKEGILQADLAQQAAWFCFLHEAAGAHVLATGLEEERKGSRRGGRLCSRPFPQEMQGGEPLRLLLTQHCLWGACLRCCSRVSW